MKIYLITDTHLGHEKKLCLFGRPHEYSEIILHNLIDVKSSSSDVLLHLGDVCNNQDAFWHKRLLASWPGKSWLVTGNHDSKSDSWYLDIGWDFVGEQILLNRFGHRILFSHRPVYPDGSFSVNIHGHLHDRDHEFSSLMRENLLLAIERTGYKPVLLETILKGYK